MTRSTTGCSAARDPTGRSAPDFDDPLAGIDTTVPDGADAARPGAYCLMLGDDALSARTGCRSGAAARPTSRRTSRWPTSRWTCSARPGCCWPGPPRPTRRSCRRCRRIAGAGRGRAGLLPRRPRLPQRPAGRGRQRRLRRHRRPAAAVLDLRRLALLRAAARQRATRCSPPSRPRASGSSPTTATTRPAGSSPWPSGTEESRRRLLAALAEVWPLHDELFRAHPVERRVAAAGWASTRPPSPARSTRCWPGLRRQRRRPARPRRPGRWAAVRPRRAAHGGAGPAAGRDAVGRPRPPGGDVVTAEAADAARARAVAAAVTDPELPMLTLADLGVLRGVERRRRHGRWSRSRRRTRAARRWRRCATTWSALAQGRGYADVRVRVELSPGVVQRLDQPARPAGAGRARHLPARAGDRAGRARSPLTLLPAAPERALPALRVGRGRAGLGVRRRPPARRCTGAPRCLEPFEHVKEI